MDTSEQYIKMRMGAMPDLGCGTSPFNPVGGSHILDDTDGRKTYVDFSGNWYIYFKKSGEWCQLERQDQLQEMVVGLYGDFLTMLIFFQGEFQTDDGDFVMPKWSGVKRERIENGRKVISFDKVTSMEQLWLAFVMKEKYNKTWTGDKWAN